jgi:hypothetical protein
MLRNPHKKAAALLQMPENVLLQPARQKTPGQPETSFIIQS